MSDDSDICTAVLMTIRKIIQAFDLHSKQLISSVGVTGPQLVILQEIFRSHEITITELSKKIMLSQPTVTNILNRLEEVNLIQKVRGIDDKRKWTLTLTEHGNSFVGNSPSPLHPEFIKDFRALPDWQQTQILSTLQRVASMMSHKKHND